MHHMDASKEKNHMMISTEKHSVSFHLLWVLECSAIWGIEISGEFAGESGALGTHFLALREIHRRRHSFFL